MKIHTMTARSEALCLGFRILAVLVCLAALRPEPAPAQERQADHVIIISIDGFPARALWDERIALPNLRALAREGAWAHAMIPSTPSVTWPNHTTMVTGVHPEKHGVLMNGRFVRGGPGEPVTRESDLDRAEMTSHPSLFDVAYRAGLRTSEVNWPVTRSAATLHESFPDAPQAVAHTTEPLRSELAKRGVLEDADVFGRMSYAGRDHVWTAAATHLLRSRGPHLLLLHLLVADGLQHGYAAESQPAFAALTLADVFVGDVLEALAEAGIRRQTAVFVVSDHGFMNVTRRVQPNVLLGQVGLLEAEDDGRITSALVQSLSNGGSAMVFATDPSTASEDLERARQVLEGAEGIARVLTSEEYAAYGLPHPTETDQVGDLVLAAAEGYSFGDAAEGEPVVELERPVGVHGYLSDVPEMEALFIASGRGIRTGVELEEVDNRVIAPTAARLLGLTLDSADVDALAEVLE